MPSAESGGKGGHKTLLTPEDIRLWRLVQSQVQPLANRTVTAEEAMPAPLKKKTAKEAFVSIPARLAHVPPAPLPPLVCGNYAGVDRATMMRIKRGQASIERRLDLHGMQAAQAHMALARFLKAAYMEGGRLVMVITGKGSHNGGEGVLKASLPRWLNEPELRVFILAYDIARREHGGGGAYYLLLKRNRN